MAQDPNLMRSLKVVPHTHWDREWYRPFESYRMRLVAAIDQLLTEDWPHFLLDGQTVVLDDYLEIRPEEASRLKEAIAKGKLAVGPWFVLVDEFLVSGESLVRNLLAGRRAMKAFGASCSEGYLPDMFGHIAQMPQILKGFGLSHTVVWRGVAPKGARFRWEAPDGSSVEAAWLPVGYYQTALVTPKGPEARKEALAAYVAHFGEASDAWMLAGADHMLPQLEALRAATADGLPGWQVKVSTLAEAIAGPPAEEVLHGELRDPSKAFILPGVLSTRPWIKRTNAQVQQLLERVAEPAAALALWAGLKDERVWLRQAWRQLMLNHPHDSICGCSVDQVHREMAPRFAAASQIAEGLVERALALPAAPPVPAPSFPLLALNATFAQQKPWVEVEIAWPLGRTGESPPPPPAAMAFSMADGSPLRSVPLGQSDGEVFAAELSLEPDWHPVRRYRAAVELPLDGVGLWALEAHPAEAEAALAPLVQVGGTWLESESLRLEVQDGQVALLDKAQGQWHRQLVALLDEGDRGDSYNFSPELGASPREGVLVAAQVVDILPHQATLQLSYQLKAPEGLLPDRSGWGPEVDSRYELRLTLQAGRPLVSGHLSWNQSRRDHRLRLAFAWGGPKEARLWADGAYGLFPRKTQAMGPLPTPKGTEAVMPEFPLVGLMVAGADDVALGVATRGDHEGAWLEGPGGPRLALTAMRAVGWLSRDDLATRGAGAGPRMATPEAQCPGPQSLAFALVVGSDHRLADLQQAAEAWRVPPSLFTGSSEAGLLGLRVRATHPALRFDALKPAEDGQGLILRAHNVSGSVLEEAFVKAEAPQAILASAVALDEETQGPAQADALGGHWRPYEIKSWRLTRG